MSSVSPLGLTIWDTQKAKNFTFINNHQIDFLKQLHSNTVVTLSKNGNLSFWNTFGYLTKSILVEKQNYTAMSTTKSGQIILGSQNGALIFLNSKKKIVKKIITDSPIVDMTILLNDDVATVDKSKKIKIYKSKNYTLDKIFYFSDKNGQIDILSIGFIKNIEHLIYSIESKLFIFDYKNENLVKIINAPGNIVKVKYVKNGIVALAIGQYLYYYDLLTGFCIDVVAIYQNIESMNTNGSHIFVGTRNGEIAALKIADNFVKTSLKNEKLNEIYIAMNNKTFFILDSNGKIKKSLVTDGKILSIALLSSQHLVTLESNNAIKIWQPRTLKLNKAILGLNSTGSIQKIDTCFISNLEYILYTTESTLFVLDYTNSKIFRQINASQRISAVQYIKNDHVVLAVGNNLVYYHLKNGIRVENVTMSREIVDLYSFNAELKVTLINGKIVFFSLAKYIKEAADENSKSLKSVMVRQGVIIPVANGNVILVEKQTANIILEKTLFKSEMMAFQRLNDSIICAISKNGDMVLINPDNVEILKKFEIKKTYLDESIDSLVIVNNKFVLIKCFVKIIQVNIESGEVDLFKINK